MPPRVELVATGSELLNGSRVNTHAQLLARRLAEIGLTLTRETTVPDDMGRLLHALREGLASADVLFVTGGLGPTCDDLTREALAAVTGRRVVEDEASLAKLRARYRGSGRELTPSRARQARVVEGAEALENPVGAAPGQRLRIGRRVVILLPGPPGELEAILDRHVLPWLAEHYAAAGHADAERLFMVCGLGESDIVDRFARAGFAPPGVALAYCASPGRVEVRLRREGAPPAAFVAAVEEAARLLGDTVYARTRVEMEVCVGERLRDLGRTLATAESCTGGLVGQRLTSVAGSSAYYLGGVIAYHNRIKAAMLGVPAALLEREGAVSAAVAEAMAEGVRARFDADYGLAITGVAGPGGGTPEKPVGLVFTAVADARGAASRRLVFGFGRTLNQWWSSQMALDQLRRRLPPPPGAAP